MTKTEEIMDLAREYAFRSSELVGEYPPSGDECEWAKQSENDLKSAIEELVREVEYKHTHTLVECPQCGFTGAREYEPKETP